MQTSRMLAAGIKLGLVLLAGPAIAASSDYLLELDGIKGEAASAGPRQTIEISSFSWGVSNPTSVGSGSSGMSAGKVSVQDLSVMRAPESPASVATARERGSGMASGKRVASADGAGEAGADVAVSPPVGSVGELTVLVRESPSKGSNSPRATCAQGKHISRASLTGNGQRYEMQDLVVSSCDVQGEVTKMTLTGKVTHTKTGHVTLMK
jgi:hypothetical protein